MITERYKQIFLVTNDEDLFEHYFKDNSWSYGAASEVFYINFLKYQRFLSTETF